MAINHHHGYKPQSHRVSRHPCMDISREGEWQREAHDDSLCASQFPHSGEAISYHKGISGIHGRERQAEHQRE